MKAHGHSRRDKLTCTYGCCGFKSHKKMNQRKVVDRTNRKSARQLDKKTIFTSLIDGDNTDK